MFRLLPVPSVRFGITGRKVIAESKKDNNTILPIYCYIYRITSSITLKILRVWCLVMEADGLHHTLLVSTLSSSEEGPLQSLVEDILFQNGSKASHRGRSVYYPAKTRSDEEGMS